MLCIAVAPESRRLGKVDLFNAAPQCDLIEFRLDRLGKEPDLKEMMEGINKPILISCRRKADGGAWTDSEEERLMLIRKAIVAGPAAFNRSTLPNRRDSGATAMHNMGRDFAQGEKTQAECGTRRQSATLSSKAAR